MNDKTDDHKAKIDGSSVQPMKGDMDALGKIDIRRAVFADKQSGGALALDDGEHLFACLDRMSASWSDGVAPNLDGAKFSSDDTASERTEVQKQDAPSFESLAVAAEERGVDLSYDEKPLSALKAADLPVIAILKNGLGVIITELKRGDKKAQEFGLLCHGDARSTTIEDLEALYSGVVVAPRPTQQKGAEIAASGRRARRGSDRDGHLARFQLSADAAPSASDPTPQSESLLSILLKAMRDQHKGLLAQLLVASALSNLLMITLPLFIMTIYDRVIPHRAMETLWALSIGVFIALLLDITLRKIKLVLVDAVGLAASTRMQARLYRRLVHIKMAYAPKTAGSLTSALRDVESVSTLLPNLIAAVLVDLPFIFLVMVLIYYVAGSVVVAPIVGVVLIALVTYFSHRKITKASTLDLFFSHKRINSLIETVSSLGAIKAIGAQDRLIRRWERGLDAGAIPSHESRLYSGLSSQMTMIIVQMVIVGAVIIGVYRISAGNMSVGALAATTLLVGRVLSPVGQLMTYLVRTTQLINSANNVGLLLDAPEEKGGDHAAEHIVTDAKIACHNLSLTYDGGAAPAIKDINLVINPGEKIGIVGRNGSGKTSLLSVMTRFYDPSGGSLAIDDMNAQQIAPQHLREAISLMPQDTALFDGTLYENLTFGLESFDQKRMARALSVSGVAEFVRHHPEGFSMSVGPRGERLSGGERQSVVLARTLLRESKVFILDEPTASMDNSTEAKIVANLKDYVGHSTLIISTHRANLLSLVDRIIWMDKGKIIADGKSDDVLARLRGAA